MQWIEILYWFSVLSEPKKPLSQWLKIYRTFKSLQLDDVKLPLETAWHMSNN